MHKGFVAASALLVTLAFGAACTVHNTEVPSLTGPSELALSLTVTATPDSISQDGASASSIQVFARDANGSPIQGLTLRLDMAVNFTVQDYGTLSARTIVTGSNGKANAVYTAPPPPPPSAGGSGTHVSIVVTPIGTNAQVSNPQSGPASISTTVDIRLVPPGVILPPADTPTASFTVVPTAPTVKAPALFDGSSSCGGTKSGSNCLSSSLITTYAWSFGDGSTGSGVTPTHAYSTTGTYTVTLTVTNDRGVAASTTQTVTVAVSSLAAQFTLSPGTAVANQPLTLDASTSTVPSGARIVDYAWNFGDNTLITHATSPITQHTYFVSSNATYTITLTITDNFGNTAVKTNTVSVTGVGSPASAVFLISPSPGIVNQPVTFDGSGSSGGAGAGGGSIIRYEWNFGDASGVLSTGAAGAIVTHTYTQAGVYTVTLTVTATGGNQGTVTHTLLVQ